MAVASGTEVDRDGEILESKGWDWKDFLKNPVLLAAHDHYEWPIGKVNWIRYSKKREEVLFEAYIHDITPRANEAWELFKQGILRAFSVGFMSKRWEYTEEGETGCWRKSLEHELFEISAVPVPAYPGALLTEDNDDLKSWLAQRKDLSADLCKALNLTSSECGLLVPASSIKTGEPGNTSPEDFEIDEDEFKNIDIEEGVKSFAELQERVEKLEIESINLVPDSPKKQRVRLVSPKQKMSREEINALVKQQIKNAGVGDIIKDAVKDHLNLIRGRVT